MGNTVLTQFATSMDLMEVSTTLIVFSINMENMEASTTLQVPGINIPLAMMFKQLIHQEIFMVTLQLINLDLLSNFSRDLANIYDNANGDLEDVQEILCDAL